VWALKITRVKQILPFSSWARLCWNYSLYNLIARCFNVFGGKALVEYPHFRHPAVEGRVQCFITALPTATGWGLDKVARFSCLDNDPERSAWAPPAYVGIGKSMPDMHMVCEQASNYMKSLSGKAHRVLMPELNTSRIKPMNFILLDFLQMRSSTKTSFLLWPMMLLVQKLSKAHLPIHLLVLLLYHHHPASLVPPPVKACGQISCLLL
jgi:hypothetical protein